MLALAIDVLPDFDLDVIDDAAPLSVESDMLEVEPLGVPQAVETARRIEEACAELRAELRAEADDRICRALDQQAARFAVERDAMRRAWTEEEAGVLAAALATAMAEVRTRIADTVAQALRPFLAERAVEQAIDGLAAQIRRVLADPDHPVLTVSGPADLLARVSAALAAEAGAVSFQPDDRPDIRVVAGTTLLETRIQDWLGRLTEGDA